MLPKLSPPPSVKLPAVLLADRRLTAWTKVLWAYLQPELRPDPDYCSIRGLTRQTGFSRNTIRACLGRLAEAGYVRRGEPGPDGRYPWQPRSVPPPAASSGPEASVPLHLLNAHGLRPQCTVLYACLQLAATGRKRGQVRYAELPALAGVCYNTAKAAVRDLEPYGWVSLTQQDRLCPLTFVLENPVYARQLAEVEEAWRRIEEAPHRGEAIMHELCSVRFASRHYIKNATLGWLISPRTGQELEFDRYYPRHGVGIEHNGLQHYGPTAKYPDREAARRQRERDLWKLGLSVEEGVDVIVIRSEELSLKTLEERAEGLLPLRDLTGHELLVEYLEHESRKYREWAATLNHLPPG